MPRNLSELEIAVLKEEEIEEIKSLEAKLNSNNSEATERVYLIAVKNKPSAGFIHI